MKLLDILNEKREIPIEEKVDISVLKEFIFKDWQTFNQKMVPTFKLLRNRIVKENYNTRSAKNTVNSIVDFAAKKYVAECTTRQYLWNEIFPKNERLNLVNELIEFFERYNINENNELIVEQGASTREAKITFSEIEVEVVDNHPRLVLNFNFDEATTNYITTALANGQTLKLSDSDFQLIRGLFKIGIEDVSSGQKLSYLKFNVKGSSISRTDLKHLIGGAFLNRVVNLEVSGSEGEQQEEPQAEPEIPQEEPQKEPTPQATEPVRSIDKSRQKLGPRFKKQPELSDKEIKEIVNESIKKFMEK